MHELLLGPSESLRILSGQVRSSAFSCFQPEMPLPRNNRCNYFTVTSLITVCHILCHPALNPDFFTSTYHIYFSPFFFVCVCVYVAIYFFWLYMHRRDNAGSRLAGMDVVIIIINIINVYYAKSRRQSINHSINLLQARMADLNLILSS